MITYKPGSKYKMYSNQNLIGKLEVFSGISNCKKRLTRELKKYKINNISDDIFFHHNLA